MVKSVLNDVNNFDTFIISIATDPKNTEAIRNKFRGLFQRERIMQSCNTSIDFC